MFIKKQKFIDLEKRISIIEEQLRSSQPRQTTLYRGSIDIDLNVDTKGLSTAIENLKKEILSLDARIVNCIDEITKLKKQLSK